MRKFFILVFVFVNFISTAQSKKSNTGFSLMAGYGIEGNLFVRSKDYAYKKKFIGTNLSFNIGLNIGKRSEFKLGYTRQENYSKRLIYSGVSVFINANVRHVNNIFDLTYSRSFSNKKNILKTGLGVFYLRPQQEEVDYGSNGILWEERNQKYNNLNDAGVLTEISYEYKFQPKVTIGIRSQFYFNVTAGIAESITLYPYIKILF